MLHTTLITSGGEIPSDYFQMCILPQIKNWFEDSVADNISGDAFHFWKIGNREFGICLKLS